ncbi:replication termination factor 2 [Punica granatum]|uniref:Ubiquitin-like domain-containing protein n=2 Tax=Punica granatum TaxID=22663 RepID=A0A218W0L3_PUNGR|nr:replication termination factor 2 [Punica granatum]OWM65811.1 hypothetical protein CDL15_Pgr015236 [Punica granatum]PKI52324.1 hypothetical protein CRG98_027250 [Punica granatum]
MPSNSLEPLQRQIFVQFSEAQIPLQTLALSPTTSQTFHHLKLSLLPNPAQSSNFYFTLNGRTLDDSAPISRAPIANFSTLILHGKLRGGGGDGGATGAESRDCYLNMYAEKKPDKVDPNEQRLSKWLNCALSYEPLREPCVIDKLGNVFNKEALVEALLGKKLPKAFRHIRGLKDMMNIELSWIPGIEKGHGGTQFQCPITGLEFNGKYKFFALRGCGHVLSAKALKEVKSSSCLVCHEEFEESDRIVINGSEEEVAVLRERLEEERMKIKEKKPKKAKNGQVGDQIVGVKQKASAKGEGNGNGKADSNGSAKRFKAADLAPANANKEVYASLFTSSRKSNFKETFSCRSLPLGRN